MDPQVRQAAAKKIRFWYVRLKGTKTERVDFAHLRKQHRERTNLIQEILQTEKNYVKHLKDICELYLIPLREDTQTNKEKALCSEEEITIIFGEVELILQYNEWFLEMLEERITENWSPSDLLSDLFLSMSRYLLEYSHYINNYYSSFEVLEQKKANTQFAAFMRAKTTKLQGMDLSSLLITPVQRIPRYELLLTGVLKNTWPWHRDFDNLTKAVKTVKAIGETINEKIREVEQMNICQQKEKLIIGIPKTIVKPGRKFVDETSFSVLGKATNHHTEKFKVFMFTDILLWAKKNPKAKDKDKVDFDRVEYLEDLTAKDYFHPERKSCIQIVSVTSAPCTVDCKSEEIKQKWLTLLNEPVEMPLYNPLDGKQIKRTRSFDAFAKKKEDAEKFTDIPLDESMRKKQDKKDRPSRFATIKGKFSKTKEIDDDWDKKSTKGDMHFTTPELERSVSEQPNNIDESNFEIPTISTHLNGGSEKENKEKEKEREKEEKRKEKEKRKTSQPEFVVSEPTSFKAIDTSELIARYQNGTLNVETMLQEQQQKSNSLNTKKDTQKDTQKDTTPSKDTKDGKETKEGKGDKKSLFASKFKQFKMSVKQKFSDDNSSRGSNSSGPGSEPTTPRSGTLRSNEIDELSNTTDNSIVMESTEFESFSNDSTPQLTTQTSTTTTTTQPPPPKKQNSSNSNNTGGGKKRSSRDLRTSRDRAATQLIVSNTKMDDSLTQSTRNRNFTVTSNNNNNSSERIPSPSNSKESNPTPPLPTRPPPNRKVSDRGINESAPGLALLDFKSMATKTSTSSKEPTPPPSLAQSTKMKSIHMSMREEDNPTVPTTTTTPPATLQTQTSLTTTTKQPPARPPRRTNSKSKIIRAGSPEESTNTNANTNTNTQTQTNNNNTYVTKKVSPNSTPPKTRKNNNTLRKHALTNDAQDKLVDELRNKLASKQG